MPRRPKPTALKQLAGNPGKRPLNFSEPRFDPGPITVPRQLGKLARVEWRRLAPLLQANSQ